MRYITHEFAHPETLDRAHRWLIQAGIEPSRIEVSHQGAPRLAVLAMAGEAAVVELVVGAASTHDPEGLPGFWDWAHHHRKDPSSPARPVTAPVAGLAHGHGHAHRTESFLVSWRPIDAGRETIQTTTSSDVELRREFVERWD